MPDPLQSDSSYNPKVGAPRAPDLAVAARARRQLGKQIVGAGVQAGAMIKRASAKMDQNEYALALAEADTEINAVTAERLSPQGEPIPHDVYEAKLQSINTKYASKVPKSHQKEFETAMVRKMGNGTTRSLEHAVKLQDLQHAQLVNAGANDSLTSIKESPYDVIYNIRNFKETYIDPMAAEEHVKTNYINDYAARAFPVAVDHAITSGGQVLEDVRAILEDKDTINGTLSEETRLALIKKMDTAQVSYTVSSLNDTANLIDISQDAMVQGNDPSVPLKNARTQLDAADSDFQKNKKHMSPRQIEAFEKKRDDQSNYLTAIGSIRKITAEMPQKPVSYALMEIQKATVEAQEALDRGDRNAAVVAQSKQKALRTSNNGYMEIRKDPAQMAAHFDGPTMNLTNELIIRGKDPSIAGDIQTKLTEASFNYQRKIGVREIDLRYLTDSKRDSLNKMLTDGNSEDLFANAARLETLYKDDFRGVMAETFPDNPDMVVGLTATDVLLKRDFLDARANFSANQEALSDAENSGVFSAGAKPDDIREALRVSITGSGVVDSISPHRSTRGVVTNSMVTAMAPMATMYITQGMAKDDAISKAVGLVSKGKVFGHRMSIDGALNVSTEQVSSEVAQWQRPVLEATMQWQRPEIQGLSEDARRNYFNSTLHVQSNPDSKTYNLYIEMIDPEDGLMKRSYIPGNEFDSQGRRMNLEGDFSAYQNAATLTGQVPVSLLESAASALAVDPSKMLNQSIGNWRDDRSRQHGSLLSVPQALIEGTGVELETYGRVGVFESVMLMRLGLQGSLDKRGRDIEQSEDASVRVKR